MEIIRRNILSMQVCCHKHSTDEEVEAFANEANPTGIESDWIIAKQGHHILAGDNERVPCGTNSDHIHVVLYC